MEVSFASEAAQLRLGAGGTFRGEGVLGVTKALLQSGVSYVGGYQGAPVSHLLDVMVQSRDLLDELGVHLETCANEAAAGALLGASIAYPLRGAVTWKSVVGTNVASDALSNLASAGVTGGVLIILGEDYGEGASVIQERSHAFALKSSIWLLDPRPDLARLADMVEHAFALSEASNTPVMMELRIRACHRYGEFETKDNIPPANRKDAREIPPAPFDYGRLSHPPSTFEQEKDKLSRRLPAALAYIRDHGLNDLIEGEIDDVGLIVQGGLFNTLLPELARLGFADRNGGSRLPMLVLNVVHPILPDQINAFCEGKRAVLVLEEGAPDYIEQFIGATLRRAGLSAALHGKDVLPPAGEYTAEAIRAGLRAFLARAGLEAADDGWETTVATARQVAAAALGSMPDRPPSFCVGCPERPFFTALKLVQRDSEVGPLHVAADIGCHALATFPPFDSGQTILGYGMSLASSQAVAPFQARRPVAVMGDGGFWHNGLITGVAGGAFNQADQILVVLDNGYSSATGVQDIPSSRAGLAASITAAVQAVGVRWVRKALTYRVAEMTALLKQAVTTADAGLKVIVAEGECMLARQRRERTETRARLASGKRVVRVKYGVDEAICTGDHACIRLSGCPSLTLKPRSDPLRDDPVAHVDNDCVGCGLCGEVAHAAQLCPSFYRAELVRNPGLLERVINRIGLWATGVAVTA
jgi:indolepyruvate ferredoxin oxidoreductase alpha subunit